MTDSLQKRIEVFLFKLFAEKIIFADIEDKLRVLFSGCENDDDAMLIEHLLSNFYFYSQRQMSFALKFIAQEIIKYADGEKTALVATAIDNTSDSSQAVIYGIKHLIAEHDNIVIFNGVIPFIKKLKDYDKCFLIDDFSGTGQTLISREKYISNDAKQKSKKIEISVFLLGGMQAAEKNLREKFTNVTIHKVIKAGISGYFENGELEKYTLLMNKFEERLGGFYKGKPLPNFGYGRAEALYAVQEWNVPNSNFPIFWWPVDVDNKKRSTCFVRAEL